MARSSEYRRPPEIENRVENRRRRCPERRRRQAENRELAEKVSTKAKTARCRPQRT